MLAALSATFSGLAVTDPSAQTNLPPEQIEANSNAIENRAANIMNALALSDPNKAIGVHDIVFAQCQALSAWHNENDPKLKAAKSDTNTANQIQASLKQLHDQFITKLSENLTPSQIEIVKDKMTHGVVQVTYNAYLEIVPNLTDADKAKNSGVAQGWPRRSHGRRKFKRKSRHHQKIQGQNKQLSQCTRS